MHVVPAPAHPVPDVRPLPVARAWPRPARFDLLELALLVIVPLVVALGFHPIGDHYTESDFYGAYATGARLLLAGHVDPTRYGIYGPVYEWLLAGAGAIGLELFFAAKLLSVAGAAVVLASTWAMVAASLGRGAARWAILLVAATPVFLRYAYSATTDMPAAAFAAAALALLVLGRRPRTLAIAGVLLALAALTRYQAIALVPAGLLVLALRRGSRGNRGRLVAAFGLAFAFAIAPWTGWSVAHGFVPGESLVGNYRFYATETGSRNVQDQPIEDEEGHALPPATTRPESPLVLWPHRVFEHAEEDATVLLGFAFAVAALAGALVWVTQRFGSHGGAWAIAAVFLYLGLVPAFYSDRYRLLLVPVYAAAAAALWAAPFARTRAPRVLVAIALAGVVGSLAAKSWEVQHRVWVELPRDVLAVAHVLTSDPTPGTVLARKGHIGYYGDRPVTPLPRVASIPTLAAIARAGHARYLYYSWYETQLRPELLALLDTTRTLPGLVRVAVSGFPAGVLYRIEPGFGDPGWFANDREHALAEARAAIWTLSDSAAARGRSVLAADAFLRGDYRRAVAMAKQVRRELPGDSLAMWVEAYGEAKLAGLGESSPRIAELRSNPTFGWMVRAARSREVSIRRTAGGSRAPEPAPPNAEDRGGIDGP